MAKPNPTFQKLVLVKVSSSTPDEEEAANLLVSLSSSSSKKPTSPLSVAPTGTLKQNAVKAAKAAEVSNILPGKKNVARTRPNRSTTVYGSSSVPPRTPVSLLVTPSATPPVSLLATPLGSSVPPVTPPVGLLATPPRPISEQHRQKIELSRINSETSALQCDEERVRINMERHEKNIGPIHEGTCANVNNRFRTEAANFINWGIGKRRRGEINPIESIDPYQMVTVLTIHHTFISTRSILNIRTTTADFVSYIRDYTGMCAIHNGEDTMTRIFEAYVEFSLERAAERTRVTGATPTDPSEAPKE